MKWKLTDIYSSDKEWEKDFIKNKKLLELIIKYKGKLNLKLEEFYTKYEELEIDLLELYVYSRMKYDLDLTEQVNESMFKKIQLLESDMAQKLSWVEPEILELGEKKVMELVSNSSKLMEYEHDFDSLFYSHKHILDKEKEELLSYYTLFNGTPKNIYTAFRYSDSKPVKVKLSDGRKIEVMDQNYTSLLTIEKSQENRKRIFEAMYQSFENNKNMLSNVYLSIVNKNIATCKARKYDSFLNIYLDGEKVPTEVYTNLLDVCKESKKHVKKYLDLKKKKIGLKEYRSYDRFVPLVEVNKKYSYENAKKLVMDSVKGLPNHYIEKVKEAMTEGYIDVMPNPNKKGGAYAWGTYKTHPYVLLNFNGTLSDVSTLAHEVGHAVHKLYSDENQPFATCSHSIFVAEVASTFLERVLVEDLLEKSSDKNEKIYLLQKMIDGLIGTFYRQSMFADFEYTVHTKISKGSVMTEKDLSNLGINLYKSYYGFDITDEKYKRLWWSFIPHIYNSPFYVYKYATCYTVSSKLYDDYLKDKSKFENFVNLLKAGADDYPFNQILKCNVDLSKKETYITVVENLKRLVERLEELLK